MTRLIRLSLVVLFTGLSAAGWAQTAGAVRGKIVDETGGAMPGVTVELRADGGMEQATVTDAVGQYAFDALPAGTYHVSYTMINFATIRRDVVVANAPVAQDVVLHLSLNAEVTVTGSRTFANLADMPNPEEDLVGVAQSASQGAITARQLDVRPVMRAGEVLETVPGVIITQHSGEGKANQYFLRGFNLDHGSDFAQTIAGAPVNMPTHAHSHGYSDINFLIPELVSGVQFSKGPYFADQGDFSTAGSSNINYATVLDRPIVHLETGTYGYRRGLFAASPKVGAGHLLAAFETSTNSGPWSVPDSYKKLNGVLRYSKGDSVNGFSVTAMGYHGEWNATEAVPQRAVDQGLIGRFGSLDPTDGGHTYRYSGVGEWQRGGNGKLTKITAYGILYDLHLISNFTFFLDDPIHGDQKDQVDHRFVSGVKVTQTRLGHFFGREAKNTFGLQVRNDDITNVALYHTEARVRIGTESQASVVDTTAGLFAQSEVEWAPWMRSTLGLRGDTFRFKVNALDPANSGTATASIVNPKAAVTFGPWKKTEFYANAGTSFHSNSALGTTITRDAAGNPAERVTPLVRAKGAEVGARSVIVPHLQTTVSLWTLRLGSELIYNGDVGATEPGPASQRWGVEFANYWSPFHWLIFDADYSWSRARFPDIAPPNNYVPEAVNSVVSAGASVDNFHRVFGSVRLRYFGPRPLIEDNSVRSKATKLVNLDAGYQVGPKVRTTLTLFNVFNSAASDIDYYYASRLPGEPLGGVEDIHFHPVVPRTLRVSLIVAF